METQTIQTIAQASPEMQALLQPGLGIQSILITDGNNLINLFETANGLLGSMTNHSTPELA